jgi:hypothetical protein
VVFLGSPVTFTNKTDRHGIAEILLKVTLNTITLAPLQTEEMEHKECIKVINKFISYLSAFTGIVPHFSESLPIK